MSALVPGLRMTAARYQYAGTSRNVLDGVDLEVLPGEVVGVVGANESGKSTLCLVAAGMAPALIGGRIDGSVTLGGTETRELKPYELAQRSGLLFQNPATQLSGTAVTVFEEVAFGPRNLGLPLEEIVERVGSAMEALGIDSLAPRDPQRLSGGQAQLVALASVLALRPGFLVLDEPTSQLDPEGTRIVGEALRRLARAGTALLLVEHKTDLLEDLADRIVVLADGHVAMSGRAREILDEPALIDLGVEPPASARLSRALATAGVRLGSGLIPALDGLAR